MPLRREVSQLDRAARRDEGMTAFGLDPQWPTILVTGGSLGAQRLNASFAARAAELSAAGLQVLHVTGAGKEFEPGRPDVGAPYVVVPYADRMELAYAAADLVVCRSGANTVCELTAVGLPAVYVPLPIGNGSSGSTRPTSSPPVVGSSSRTRCSPPSGSPTTSSLCWRRRAAARDGFGRRVGRTSVTPTTRWPTWSTAPTPHVRSSRGCVRRRRLAMTLPQTRFDFLADVPAAEDLGRVHFVAIGGAGMSGVARILLAKGVPVSGSDARESTLLHALAAEGASRASSATTPPSSTTPTPSSSPRPSVTTTPSCGPRMPGTARTAPRPGARGHHGRVAPGGRRGSERQDHDDLAAHRRAAGLRGRPVLRRRAASWRSTGPTRTSGPATCSSSRRTRATGRSSSTGPRSRSSPACRPTTSTSTAPSRRSRRHTRAFVGTIVPGGLLVACADDQGERGSRTSRARGGSGC